MCRSFKNLGARCIPILVVALLTVVMSQTAYGDQNPAGCSGSAVTLSINPFACTNPADVTTCTIPIPGTGPVVDGETIAYSATLAYPAGNTCGFEGGTITLILPNGAAVPTALPDNGDTAGNCFGCTGDPTSPFTTGKAPYVASIGDAVGGFITAQVQYSGGILHSGASNSPGPTASNTYPLEVVPCSATVDKQVSCDGGTTWYDVSADTTPDDPTAGTTLGCIAQAGQPVQIRFRARNTGGAPISCTISDNVFTIGPGGVFTDLAPDNFTSFITLDPLACNLTAGQSGENTATVGQCTCPTTGGGTVPGTGSSDTATYACCGVLVDKQVSCAGGAFVDPTLVAANEDGTNGCSALFGQPVAAQYRVQNTGNVPLVCEGTSGDGDPLGLVDIFVVNAQTTFTGGTTLAPGATSGFFTDPVITQCSAELNANEAQGDQITANCECQAGVALQNNVEVTASDIAQIQCTANPPSFTVTKACVPATAAGNFTASATVNNLGTSQLSCTFVDEYVSGPCGSAPACPISGGTPVTLLPTPLVVPASSSDTASGDILGLTSTVCNQVCATCTPADSPTCATAADCPAAAGTTVDCVAGACQYTPDSAAIAECPVGFCFTRTPGYWGTHPQVTQTLLPLTVCNQALTTTTALQPMSATENLCMSGQDAKASKGNSFYTSPQQLQLIRQCTAAALNLAASGDGSIEVGLSSCVGQSPAIDAIFNSCCVGPTSTCSSGATSNAISTSQCIFNLDAFNNLHTGDFEDVGLVNSPAQPEQCRDASGNHATNCTNSPVPLGGTINCGPK